MITLIFPPSPFLLNQSVFPPMGIMYLSAFLKSHGIDVQLLDMGLGHTLDQIKYDIVGISITTPQRYEAFSIARELIKRGKLLVAGGPHATYMPHECKEAGFTFVLRGEAEADLTNLILFIGNVSGSCTVRQPLNIDEFPFPDRSALPIRQYKYYIDDELATVMMSSRNCVFNCAFCAKLPGKYRAQSAKRTLAEIEHVHSMYGYKAIMFFDDCFTLDIDRLKTIANGVNGSGIKFRCFGRSNTITDNVCALLKRMGVVEVGIGVESGSAEILHKNMKGTTPAMNTRAVRTLEQYGIRTKAFMIVGLPGETHKTIDETRRWLRDVRPYDVDISVFQPLPGSRIFGNPEKWGVTFSYNGVSGWYKGTPGEYKCMASTKELSSDEIVKYRDELEMEFKRKENLR